MSGEAVRKGEQRSRGSKDNKGKTSETVTLTTGVLGIQPVPSLGEIPNPSHPGGPVNPEGGSW